MVRSCYVIEYEGRFRFAVPPAFMWSVLQRLDDFPRWWTWLHDFRAEGDGLTAGAVLRGTVTPPLPYRMSVRVDVERCIPARLVDASVHGDLEGDAHLRLEPDDGEAGTRADVAWALEMRQRPMRVAARVAHPLMRWGHDRVVDATVMGFRSRLRALQDGRP
jgi:carbon monoxide dehydrogenase subunit G